MHRQTTIVALVVVSLLGVTVGAPTALAADDAGPLETAFSSDDAGSTIDALIAGVKGQGAALLYEARHSSAPFFGGEESDTASDELESVQSYYNPRSTAFESWINERTTASTDYDVIALEFQLNDETATGYLVADVENDSYENSSIVDETNRTVDQNVTVCGMAADEAPTELKTFYVDSVETGDDVSASYLGRLAGSYRSNVETSLPIGAESGGECGA